MTSRRALSLRALGNKLKGAGLVLALMAATIVTSIGLTTEPASAATGCTAYVTNGTGDVVTPIDVATAAVLPRIPVGDGPISMAVSRDGSTLYVLSTFDGLLTPVDVATDLPGTPIPIGRGAWDVAITPDGNTAYVVQNFTGQLIPVDLTTNTVQAPILLGRNVRRVVLTQDGATAFVTAGGGELYRVELATGTFTVQDLPGGDPREMAMTPDGRTLYVTSNFTDVVNPVDVSSGLVGAPIPVGDRPYGIAITPDGRTGYVSNEFDDNVIPFDVATHVTGAPIPTRDRPTTVAILPDGSTVYAVNSEDGSITPIDTATNTAQARIRVGQNPFALAFTGCPAAASAVFTPGAPAIPSACIESDIVQTSPNAAELGVGGHFIGTDLVHYQIVSGPPTCAFDGDACPAELDLTRVSYVGTCLDILDPDRVVFANLPIMPEPAPGLFTAPSAVMSQPASSIPLASVPAAAIPAPSADSTPGPILAVSGSQSSTLAQLGFFLLAYGAAAAGIARKRRSGEQ